jgi:dienelactone hydrolase
MDKASIKQGSILSEKREGSKMVRAKYFKRIYFLFPILLCLFIQIITEGRAEETVSITTDDGKALRCIYFPPAQSNSPGLILLPDTRCDAASFGSIPEKLNKAGFAVLAMDFRYKAIIAKAGNRKQQISTIQKQDLMALVKYDTKSGINFLAAKKEVDPERIALIGTSLGSRVAIISGAEYDLKALVLISLSGDIAFPDYKPIKEILSDYGEKPILFMTATKDWGGNYKAAEHNKQYYDWKNGKKELKIFSGSGHGVDILKKKEAIEIVTGWLKSNM